MRKNPKNNALLNNKGCLGLYINQFLTTSIDTSPKTFWKTSCIWNKANKLFYRFKISIRFHQCFKK